MIMGLLATASHAVPITRTYDLDIRDCVIFPSGAPYLFADDCIGTLTVETDTTIDFDTPDAGQTGSALIEFSSLTYGATSALFFNYLEEVWFDADGNEIEICISYCFSTGFDANGELAFNWGAYRGLPYSTGSYSGGIGTFEFEDSFRKSDGSQYEMLANGRIVAHVPLPASFGFLSAALALLGLKWMSRRPSD